MTYLAVPPPPVLAGAVTAMAGYEEYAEATPVRRRQAPTGGCALILAWGGPIEVDGAERGAFLAGLDDTWAVTAFVGRQQGIQVDLTPLGAARLLGRGGGEVAGRAVALDDLGVAPLAALPARLAEAPSWQDRFALVGATLGDLLAGSRFAPDPEVAHAWARLSAARSRVPVAELAAETGWSRRHLLTRFRRQVGLPPTAVGRVLRFDLAASLLVPGRGPDRVPTDRQVADIAAACGFADHSHLVREFRDLAGVTPSGYVREWFPDVQDEPRAAS